MKARIEYQKIAPAAFQAMLAFETYVRSCGLEPALLELIKIRASQINGCAYCLDMHTKDARAAGESEQRIYALNAWRETPFFTERERAALAWTESGHVGGRTRTCPTSVYEHVRRHFSEQELVESHRCRSSPSTAGTDSPSASVPCPAPINRRSTRRKFPNEPNRATRQSRRLSRSPSRAENSRVAQCVGLRERPAL